MMLAWDGRGFWERCCFQRAAGLGAMLIWGGIKVWKVLLLREGRGVYLEDAGLGLMLVWSDTDFRRGAMLVWEGMLA